MVEPGGNCLHVGNHLGLHSLTVGQRASVGGLKSKPYVAGKHLVTKEMFVVEGENNPALFSHSFAVGDLQWTAGGAPWELRNTDADDDEAGEPVSVPFFCTWWSHICERALRDTHPPPPKNMLPVRLLGTR